MNWYHTYKFAFPVFQDSLRNQLLNEYRWMWRPFYQKGLKEIPPDIKLIQTDDGKWGVINSDGSVIVDYEPSNLSPEESNKQIKLKEQVVYQALKRLFMSLAR